MRLEDGHPTLFRQLHPTRNVGIDPGSVTNSSDDMMWWLCPEGHEWKETPRQRRSDMMWKQGDIYACLHCIAPGCTVNSCGHRRFQSGKDSLFRVLANPCDKCEITERARRILDPQAGDVLAALEFLEVSALYALFCSRGSEVVEWWQQIFPLVEAYFVRMLCLYIVIDRVQFHGQRKWTEAQILGACMLRILTALPHSCHPQMYSAIPADAGNFRQDYMPDVHPHEIKWALKKAGFDILDAPLDGDVGKRMQFLERQRVSTHSDMPPVDLTGRHYPAFDHDFVDRQKDTSTLQQLRQMKFGKVTKAVRLTLGSSAPADADDPLGRDYVGYSQELAPEELWERARGVWKLRADHVAASSIALVVFDRRVVLVASISGIAFHRGALSIVGAPISGHALIGHPDPLHTADPLAHGVFGLGQVGNGIDVISSRWVVEREPPTTAYSLRHEG
ncbi:zinc-ribbon domain-containing protein (plasmid) [Rhodococcus erythropolis]|uniref:zinc-ribbon domain-containing protein n=1 Tax=Rhodococcus erythropolis TaxID=1833 RepID=UPI00406BCB2E